MAFCKNCGNKIDDKAQVCFRCGVPVHPRIVLNHEISNSAGMRALLPVGQSWLAIVAGYAGLLSIIPGVGIIAIIFGILALRDIKKNPKKHGSYRAWTGIVLGVMFSIIGLALFL